MTAFLRAAWDITPDTQHLHRGCASAERPRSGRHPCGCTGPRKRVSTPSGIDRSSDGRRRPDQPLRAIRRDRPRRRARSVRRAQSAGASAGKRCNAGYVERLEACFAARDWDAMAEILADDTYADDRRRVVNAGTRHGRDAEIANVQAIAEVGTQEIRSTVIATRGGRLALCRTRLSGRDQRPEAFHTEGTRSSSKSTPTTGSWHASCSTLTTSTPPSRSSTPGTSPAKRPPTRTRGRSSQGPTPRSTDANYPATTPDWVNIDHRRGTGIAPGDADRRTSVPRGTSRRTSTSTSRPCIG